MLLKMLDMQHLSRQKQKVELMLLGSPGAAVAQFSSVEVLEVASMPYTSLAG